MFSQKRSFYCFSKDKLSFFPSQRIAFWLFKQRSRTKPSTPNPPRKAPAEVHPQGLAPLPKSARRGLHSSTPQHMLLHQRSLEAPVVGALKCRWLKPPCSNNLTKYSKVDTKSARSSSRSHVAARNFVYGSGVLRRFYVVIAGCSGLKPCTYPSDASSQMPAAGSQELDLQPTPLKVTT